MSFLIEAMDSIVISLCIVEFHMTIFKFSSLAKQVLRFFLVIPGGYLAGIMRKKVSLHDDVQMDNLKFLGNVFTCDTWSVFGGYHEKEK
jgi:hypothetical protein